MSRDASPAAGRLTALAAGFLLLVLNGAYLAARADATLFYFTNVALHLVLGLGLALAALRPLSRRFGGMPAPLRAGLVLLALGGACGLVLMATGATRPYRWIVWTHVVLVAVGSLPVFAHLIGAARRRASADRGLAVGAVLATCACVVLAFVAIGQDRRAAPLRDRITNPVGPPETMEGEGSGP